MISIISIIVLLVIVGFGLWLLEQVPMDGTVKRIIIGLAILLVVLWVLQEIGLLGGLFLK